MHKLLKRFRKYDVYVPIVLTMENKKIEIGPDYLPYPKHVPKRYET